MWTPLQADMNTEVSGSGIAKFPTTGLTMKHDDEEIEEYEKSTRDPAGTIENPSITRNG